MRSLEKGMGREGRGGGLLGALNPHPSSKFAAPEYLSCVVVGRKNLQGAMYHVTFAMRLWHSDYHVWSMYGTNGTAGVQDIQARTIKELHTHTCVHVQT
jgi:hypothetical protein